MSPDRTLRGGCHCGRNAYIVHAPAGDTGVARLLFDTTPAQRLSLASPIPIFLRVPLAWYHSTTRPRYEDETPAMIRRTYEHLVEESEGGSENENENEDEEAAITKRHFCGFCGTPLSFWSEAPRAEADFIRLALGSLHPDDLGELEEWAGWEEEGEGEGEEEAEKEEDEADQATATFVLSSSTGLPWLDSFVEGSRLGRRLRKQQQRQERQRQRRQQTKKRHTLASRLLSTTATTTTVAVPGQHGTAATVRHGKGGGHSADGRVSVEWEVLEWTEGGDEDMPSPAKRSRQEE